MISNMNNWSDKKISILGAGKSGIAAAKLAQHIGESVDRVGWKPIGIGQPLDGMVGSVNVRHTIDQIKPRCHEGYLSISLFHCFVLLFFREAVKRKRKNERTKERRNEGTTIRYPGSRLTPLLGLL